MIAFLTLFFNASAYSAEIYVSPNATGGGNGSEEAPYKTLEAAKIAVRAMNASQNEDIYVYLMDGTYELSDTLEFTPEDSGKNGYNIIYKADDGAQPVISGGRKITEWEIDDKNSKIWKASAQGIDSRQLYVNGVKATRARTEESQVIPTNGFTVTDKEYTIGPITYNASDVLKQVFSASKLSELEFVYDYTFHHARLGVTDVNVPGGLEAVTVTMNSGFASIPEADRRSIKWIENSYELLDNPGEWYIDKENDVVYYMPREGENMENAEVIMPVLEQLIHGDGTDKAYNEGINRRIENIVFDGISFKYTTWLSPNVEAGYISTQGGFGTDYLYDNNQTGLKQALRLDRAKNITVKNCIFTDLGCGAIRFGCGAKNILITKNEVYNCAGGGIYVEEKQRSWVDDEKTYLFEDNTVSYNKVHNIGTEYHACVGIFMGYGNNLLVENNEVYNTPYTGISVGWGWNDLGSEDKFKTNTINLDNKIYKNLVHDVMQRLSDGGGIYNLGSQPGMEIQNNVVYNVGASDGCAYYLDDGSRFINVRNNIGYNANVAFYVKGMYNNVVGNYIDGGKIWPVSGYDASCNVENTVVTNGVYPQSIIAAAGVDEQCGITVTISGTAKPKQTVYYGLFNKNGINTSDDIFYINDTVADSDGKYSVVLKFNEESLTNYGINTSEDTFDGVITEKDTASFEPLEFYDIYDAKLVDNNLVSVFSGRNSKYNTVRLTAVIYDSKGKLVGVDGQDYSEFGTNILNVDLTKYSGAYKVKIMMWDSLNGMTPLTEFLPLELN